MHEDWHAICRAIYKGVEGAEWETMYHKCEELQKVVKCNKSGENTKATALWSVKETKDKRNR